MTSRPDTDALLSCRGLEVGYETPILPPIDLSVGRGEFWMVIGRNGSGKSTWFKTILGMIPALGGAFRVSGKRLAYVPQRREFDASFPLLAKEVVAQGLERRWDFLGPRLRTPKLVKDCLGEVGASDLADQPFRDLSEGQKQRVLLARLAVSRPDLAILDEPTAAMDVIHEAEAFQFLDRLRKEHGTTVMVVSHYLGVAQTHADHALYFDRDCNEVLVGEPDYVLSSEAFSHSFHPAPLDESCAHRHHHPHHEDGHD